MSKTRIQSPISAWKHPPSIIPIFPLSVISDRLALIATATKKKTSAHTYVFDRLCVQNPDISNLIRYQTKDNFDSNGQWN